MEIQLVNVHLTVLAFTAVVIFLADKEGFAWIRGKKEVLNHKKIHRLHALMWVGLVSMIATGAFMAMEAWSYLISLRAFQVKMLLVATLVLNGVAIGSLSKISTQKPYRELSLVEKVPLFVSGMISLGGWIGAFVAAQFMDF